MRDSVDPVQGTGELALARAEAEEADDPVYVQEQDWLLLRLRFQGFGIRIQRKPIG